jgi:hydrogenase nickel incorporation protein HypB
VNPQVKIKVIQNILKTNADAAQENRRSIDKAGMLAINLMSSPGSGKTTLLEKTIPAFLPQHISAVLVGDLQTTRDAERLAKTGAEVVQINTGKGCHLTASQVTEGLRSLESRNISFLWIENVGNMVCPSAFDLGENLRVVLLSVPEGEDKVAKYPVLFQSADAILLTKTDLIGILDYDINIVKDDISRINTRAPFFEISMKTGNGMNKWIDWLSNKKA